MRKQLLSVFAAMTAVSGVWAQAVPDNLVWVEGGSFKNTRSNYHGIGVTLSGFYIGRYEVTQKEWVEVMGGNPSKFTGDDLPVEMVSWYDCIEYCNKRSEQEGLQPCYVIDRERKDPDNENYNDEIKWTVTIVEGANGYRLPTEAEWEYAAGGGALSRSHTYSGSDEIEKVGWFWRNSGDEVLGGLWNWPAIEANHGRTRPVGSLQPNELGLHDMSGNVREWCWDWYGDLEGMQNDPKGSAGGPVRVWKGGGWLGDAFCCDPSFRGSFEQHSMGYDQGFRVCRGK